MKYYFIDIGKAYYACQNYASICGFVEWEDAISSGKAASLTIYTKNIHFYFFLLNFTSMQKKI